MDKKDARHPDEDKLLERARKFDQEALTWIYTHYHDAIKRYCYHHLGHNQTAEDLTADVFRRFLQALRKGGGPTRQLSAWLYRVAHNLIVDELRRRQYRDHASLEEGILEDTLVDRNAEGPDALAGRSLRADHVREALLELTDEQRQVIILKFLEGLSNAEVAEITGKTVGAVKALQHRGLEALRDQMAFLETPALSWVGSERAMAASCRR